MGVEGASGRGVMENTFILFYVSEPSKRLKLTGVWSILSHKEKG